MNFSRLKPISGVYLTLKPKKQSVTSPHEHWLHYKRNSFIRSTDSASKLSRSSRKKRLAKTEKRGEIALLRWATAKLSPFSSSFTSRATEHSRLSTPKWSAKREAAAGRRHQCFFPDVCGEKTKVAILRWGQPSFEHRHNNLNSYSDGQPLPEHRSLLSECTAKVGTFSTFGNTHLQWFCTIG